MRHVRTELVTTRKLATCWGCCRAFPRGTRIQKSTWVFDRGPNTVAWCATCLVMMTLIDYPDAMTEGYYQGCMVEDPRDGFADVMYATEFWPS